MIILDTSKCPINLYYNRGYKEHICEDGVRVLVRHKGDDVFSLQYKCSELVIYPYPRHIKITGDMKELAFGLAMLVQGTLETLDSEDIINEAFKFSKEGKINGCWMFGWDGDKEDMETMKQIKEFIDIYNRVYPTVLLLKD